MTPRRSKSATIRLAPRSHHGWVDLAIGPSQSTPDLPQGEVLGVIWHLSDLHVCDAESPARLEYLDRYSDSDSPYAQALEDVGTYRPQEILTVQVAVTMVETVNANASGPVTGRAADVALLTGDLVDNAQHNELQWYQTIVNGGEVVAASGDMAQSSWVGSRHTEWDDRYWHPDGAPRGQRPDRPTRVHGFPVIPGLVELARQPVSSPGLQLPWVSVYGNHDGLLQGTVAPDPDLQALAVGGFRITGLAPGDDPMVTALAIPKHGPARYVHTELSPRIAISSDPERRIITGRDFAATTGANQTYFAMDVSGIRLVCLDTVNPHGGWEGSLDQDQFTWLAQELSGADRPVVIASHHPSETLTNDYAPPGAAPRILREKLLDLLFESPQVVLWLAGHVHRHSVTRHHRLTRQFLELTTGSLIDWPQQGSIIEIIRVHVEATPHIAIVRTAIDHHAPIAPHLSELSDHRHLAALSRLLSANNYHGFGLENVSEAQGSVNGCWHLPYSAQT